MGELADKADEVGRGTRNSEWFDRAIRAGLVAYGVVHLMVAWLALQLAFGERSGSASASGALHELAQQPFGLVLIWLVAIGMFVLVAWRVVDAVWGHFELRGQDLRIRRARDLGKAVIYGYIGVSGVMIAVGNGSSGGGTDSMTAKLMDLPAGQLLVGLVGLVIVGYGGFLIREAWTDKFAEKMSPEGQVGQTGTAYVWFGKIGFTAKGIAFLIVGALFGYAAITHEAEKSGGLDQALSEVLEQPFGPGLLTVIAVGIGCFGLFCFAQARHLSR